MNDIAIVWIRRSLRLEDNAAIAAAVKTGLKIQIIFVFDTDILERFQNPYDKRLSFIATAIHDLNIKLQNLNGELLVFHGRAVEIIPKVAFSLKIKEFFAEEDFEPKNIKRDQEIANAIASFSSLNLICDHLLLHPREIFKKDNTAYRVFTPYMKIFRQRVSQHILRYDYYLNDCFADTKSLKNTLISQGLKAINLNSPSNILNQIGYKFLLNDEWNQKASDILANFVENKVSTYKYARDYPGQDGTSKLSPYIRFGLISIRECFRAAFEAENSFTWINELIWREFYAYLMYHFPETMDYEFQALYRNQVPWNHDEEKFELFKLGKTGYPLIDAAMRQMLEIGWMHNRCRMIVASFFCKNLLMDWRIGEEFFAQHLMDYELASNVGGWQWAASTGADPQPYFRVFNPILQGQKFDPAAAYVKTYVHELVSVDNKYIHDPFLMHKLAITPKDYSLPMIDYKTTRENSINIFRNIRRNSNINNYSNRESIDEL